VCVCVWVSLRYVIGFVNSIAWMHLTGARLYLVVPSSAVI